jgi:hypothetical protein
MQNLRRYVTIQVKVEAEKVLKYKSQLSACWTIWRRDEALRRIPRGNVIGGSINVAGPMASSNEKR